MKAILAIGLLALVCASVFGQVTSLKAERNDKEEKELLRLEQEVGEAYKNRDKAFYRRQFADDFIGTDALGNVLTRLKLWQAWTKCRSSHIALATWPSKSTATLPS